MWDPFIINGTSGYIMLVTNIGMARTYGQSDRAKGHRIDRLIDYYA